MPDPSVSRNVSRPHWWFWVLYALTLLTLFIVGGMVGAVTGTNPYFVGLTTCSAGGLRVICQAAKGNFYARWWDRG